MKIINLPMKKKISPNSTIDIPSKKIKLEKNDIKTKEKYTLLVKILLVIWIPIFGLAIKSYIFK